MPMEDMKNLAAFVQVARSGSFTAAAAELGISTPAVSKIISRLEQHLSTRLFTRSTRRVSVTAEGRLFLDRVSRALAQVEEGVDLLREARHEPSGTVRLWTNVAIGKDHLLPMLSDFLNLYPKVALDMRFDDHIPNLIAAEYDLAIHHTSIGGESNVVKRLAELPLVLVGSAAYLARHGVPRSPEDLAAHQCVATRSAASHPTLWEFRRQPPGKGRSLRVVVEPKGRVAISEQYDAVLNAALCGMGLTVLFAHSVLRYLQSGELKVLLPDWSPHGATIESNIVYLRYPHRTYLPFNVRVLVDFLTERFREPARVEFDPRQWAAKPR
jgi:DNA-binding transcriptional LysR family regulator